MNPQQSTLRILCYGDSNTWGKIPASKPAQRYTADQRWTGILQTKLGENYTVIEEGLNSRTTNLDDPDPVKPGRNGRDSFLPTLESHHPIDIVVLMLGTNDLKTQYDRTPLEVAEGMRSYFHILQYFAKQYATPQPKVLLISPPLVQEVRSELYHGAALKSVQLAPLYEQLAQQYGEGGAVSFLDAAQHVQPSSVDGVHLEKEEHRLFAEVIFNRLTQLMETHG